MGPANTQRPPLCRNCLNRHWPYQTCLLLAPRKGTPTPAWPFLNRRESDRDANFDDPGYV